MSTSTDLSLELPRLPVGGRALAVAKDFIAFVRKPTRGHPRSVGMKTQVCAVLSLLVVNALFSMLVCVPMLLVLHGTIGLEARPNSRSVIALLFDALLFAPVIEELMFRAGLRGARWALFGMPVVGSLFTSDWKIMLSIAGLTAIIWLIGRVQRLRLRPEALAMRRWKHGRAFIRHYAVVVWISAALFGVIHLSHYVAAAGLGWKNVFLVLAVMSQFMGGMVFSYLRLRHGLESSMAAHFTWNAFTVGLSFL
jgi:membrane protease YdiL (CAAX protease family)